jgi:hypothetical protein
MAISQLVRDFVDRSIARLRDADPLVTPDPKLPVEMLDQTVKSQSGWKGRKPIPSTVSEADLDQLEKEIKLAYPPPYRDFLRHMHFCELWGPIRWEPHIIHEWQAALRKIYAVDRQKMVGAGLIPFASEEYMDAGFVCFDTRSRLPNGDCPVVFLDHEWAGTEKEIRPLFSSAEKMFSCLLFEASAKIEFIYDEDAEDDPTLPRKRELLEQFLNLDPEGAGGPARDYWTTWLPELEE